MPSLGSFLREHRESRGLSLEQLARATRVAVRHLAALEADDLAALPPPVFTRGFVRICCQALEAPVDEALALYHRQTGETPPTVVGGTAVRHVDPDARKGGTVLVSFVLLVVLGLALFAATLALQWSRERAVDRLADVGHDEPASSRVELDGAASADAGTAGAELPAPTPPPVPPAAVGPTRAAGPPPPAGEASAVVGRVTSSYRLVARVSEPTWIRVRMEDGRATEETVPGGEVREWVSNAPFVVTVGNAGGVSLELNGRPLPPLGARGAVISRLVIPSPSQ